jgi:hypothetical protein
VLTTNQCEIPGPKVQIYFEEIAESPMDLEVTRMRLKKPWDFDR